jgi:hypothetical protein
MHSPQPGPVLRISSHDSMCNIQQSRYIVGTNRALEDALRTAAGAAGAELRRPKSNGREDALVQFLVAVIVAFSEAAKRGDDEAVYPDTIAVGDRGAHTMFGPYAIGRLGYDRAKSEDWV